MHTLKFDNRFTQALPAHDNPTLARMQVQNAVYTRVNPTPVKAPYLVAASPEVAELLGLSAADCESDAFLQAFSGNRILPGMDPHATCYGGHQFGNWAGQLGDGRAINLGELETENGHLMLQLKGAGPTPYSRTADGLAVMRSSVREFLCSEAMYHLGIPTTRALSLIGTGEDVMRDILYDGNPAFEPGAVVCRVSRSFVRFGHFQLLAARGEHSLLKQLTDHTITHHFPTWDTDQPNYVGWFTEICRLAAQTTVEWMRVGFVHGVLNTDNMSILGETIDYGPYGWLEDYDPDWTPNTTDAGHRRYRYGQQPAIVQWNLLQLANAILPLVGEAEPLEQAVRSFAHEYDTRWQAMMASKLGLREFDPELAEQLLQLLASVETDMTIFYRSLASFDMTADLHGDFDLGILESAYYEPLAPKLETMQRTREWLRHYKNKLSEQGVDLSKRKEAMNRVNPKYVLRNYLAQIAIDQLEQGNPGRVHQTLEVLRRPYDDQPECDEFAEKRPEWARSRVGCSMLSCSS